MTVTTACGAGRTTGRVRRRPRRRASLVGAAVTALVTLTGVGCAPQASSGAGDRTISYWLWDANQLPAYQACARAFERQNPGLRVDITQIGWEFYWTKLTASFIAGTEPDVFTNHVTQFPQFVDLGVLQPLDELGPTRHLRDDDYQPGLARLWRGRDGHRYGAPKDWDTVALYYDRKLTRAAGISDREMNTLDWNPRDGGSFERVLARLTVDAKGRHGDEPGFDRNRVVRYGLATNGAGEEDGQTTWSPFTGSNNWHYTDRNPWGTRYNYDRKEFKEAVGWYFGLAEKGYMPPLEEFSSETNTPDRQLGSGKAAIALHGSWMLSTFTKLKGVDLGIAATPIGPSGQRASLMGGLADSITRNADNKEAAGKWVAFLASDACQELVGRDATVFPATPRGTELAISTLRRQGVDVTPFTRHVEEGTTFSFPITEYAADITAIMKPVMEDIYGNGADLSVLDRANDQVNFLLGQDD